MTPDRTAALPRPMALQQAVHLASAVLPYPGARTHVVAMRSTPDSRVDVCHTLTSGASGLAWMWVLATHSTDLPGTWRSRRSSTAKRATLFYAGLGLKVIGKLEALSLAPPGANSRNAELVNQRQGELDLRWNGHKAQWLERQKPVKERASIWPCQGREEG